MWQGAGMAAIITSSVQILRKPEISRNLAGTPLQIQSEMLITLE